MKRLSSVVGLAALLLAELSAPVAAADHKGAGVQAATAESAPLKSGIVRRPMRNPGDDRISDLVPPAHELEKQVTNGIAKLQVPRTRLEGFSELIEFGQPETGYRTSENHSIAKLLKKSWEALRECPTLPETVEAWKNRLQQPERRMEALKVLLKFAGSYLYMGGSYGGSGNRRYDEAQKQAALAVGKCGDVETLAKALDSPDRALRYWAVMKFSTDGISPADRVRLLPKLKRIAAEDDSVFRSLAAERLQGIAGTREFLDQRLQVEASPEVLMRLVLGSHGRVDEDYKREFLVLFRPLLDHPDERVRLDALRFIGFNSQRAPMWQFPFSRDAFDRVVELTQSQSIQERHDATYALGDLKQTAPEERRQALLRLIKDGNAEVRGVAAWGLAGEKDRPEVGEALRGLLSDPSPSIRYSVIGILGATNYVKELQELARGPDERVAEDAARQLDWIAKQRATKPAEGR